MKSLNYLIIITLLFSILFISCEESSTESEVEIYGSWLRTITDDAGVVFDAEFKVTENTYDFIVLTDNSGHSGSHAEISITSNKMAITSDQDCLSLGETAEYEFLVTESNLSLIAIADSCYPRVKAIQGIWNKK